MRKRTEKFVGAIEAGGMKFVCAVGSHPGDLKRTKFPTGDDPQALMAKVNDWFKEQEAENGKLHAIGIGSFGPVDLDKDSATYGYITSTPKPGWKEFDLVGAIQRNFPEIPVAFDTDVNGAALGEFYWGTAKELSDFVYITIGTGVGAGGMSGGSLMHGLVHPEMGHMKLPRIEGDSFEGACPFHGDCWEGLCSGTAMKKRTGIQATELSADHEAWELETRYNASAIANLVCVLSPRKVIIGGSVRKGGRLGEDAFFAAVRKKVKETLNGYVVSPLLDARIDEFIVPPLLDDDAGVCGAIALAQEALA